MLLVLQDRSSLSFSVFSFFFMSSPFSCSLSLLQFLYPSSPSFPVPTRCSLRGLAPRRAEAQASLPTLNRYIQLLPIKQPISLASSRRRFVSILPAAGGIAPLAKPRIPAIEASFTSVKRFHGDRSRRPARELIILASAIITTEHSTPISLFRFSEETNGDVDCNQYFLAWTFQRVSRRDNVRGEQSGDRRKKAIKRRFRRWR